MVGEKLCHPGGGVASCLFVCFLVCPLVGSRGRGRHEGGGGNSVSVCVCVCCCVCVCVMEKKDR